uniref:Amino acid transporter n=1 Tax=Acrobeloides nanus TaxID=290746 RepID=A0A914E7I2_9BILA
MIGAFVYVELGTSIRKNGSDFAYFYYAKWYPIAFAFMAVGCIMTYPLSTAIQAETFSEYFIKGLKIQFQNSNHENIAKKLIGFSLIWLLMYLNFFSIKTVVSRFQIVATGAKILAMVIVICTGFYFLIFKGETQHFENMFENSTYAPGKLVSAMFAGLFSYDGWDILNYGTEEIENPRRTMPLAIVIGMSMIAIFYVTINISYFTVLTITQIQSSDAVAVSLAQAKLGNFQYVMPFAICILMVGTLNSTLFTASRYLHAAARAGNLPSFISCTNKYHDSPRTALFFHILLAMAFSFAGNLDQLINYEAFAEWAQRAFTMLALLYIRYLHKPVHPDAIRTPIIMPILFFVICASLVGVNIAENFQISAVGLGILLCGFISFYTFIWERSLPSVVWYQRVSTFVNEKLAVVAQVLFNGMIDRGTSEEDEFAEYEPIFPNPSTSAE